MTMSSFRIAMVPMLVMAPFVSLAGEPVSPAGAVQEEPVVSTRSYWRFHHAFGPAHYLSSDGKLVATVTRYASLNGGASGSRLTTPPPAAGWEKREFDDSRWCVQRAPLAFSPEVDSDGGGPYSLDTVRRSFARTRFLVDNPAAVKKATLELRYYGGLIVYVNGREVARGHIPGGAPLEPAGYAEPYPEEAYRPVTPEQGAWGMAGAQGFWSSSFFWVPWYYPQPPEKKETHERFIAFLDRTRRRTISVTLDPKLLVPGANVLAIENRCSPIPELSTKKEGQFTIPAPCGGYSPRMAHIGLHAAEIRAEPAGAIRTADRRPDGVQAWAEDVHRMLLEEDFLEPGVRESRSLELVGGPGGVYSAQAVIGSRSGLARPRAAMSVLTGPVGSTIPAGSIHVRWARSIPVRQIKVDNPGSYRTYMPDILLFRYEGGGAGVHWSKGKEDHWVQSRMRLFDALSPEAPEAIAGGTSQPLWLTVEVPRQAKPGNYRGELRVSAEGMPETVFAVKLDVLACAVPEPAAFKSYVGVDESPWALAGAAKVKPWSEAHWVLVEQAIRAAGRLGARVAGIPVIHDTELNNGKDGMIKWVKRADGAYDFDFTLADRYLDLWRKHCHRQPDIIIYLVHTASEYGKGGGTGAVTLVDPATKQESEFTPPKADTPEGQKLWVACARAIHAHFNARGIRDENLHWGLFYDYIGASSYALANPLAREIPGVGWARSSHEGRKIHGSAEMGGGNAVRVTWNAAVRHHGSPPFVLPRLKGGPHYAYDPAGYQVKGCLGMTDPGRVLLLPRADSDVSAMGVYPPLYQLRVTQEMAVTGKYRGAARICVDGWGRGGYFGPFTPYLLYPGKPGRLDGSAQYEMLREGLQEMEVRIGLEERANLAAEVREMLDRRTERVWVLPPRPEGIRIAENWSGWQEASRRLYEAGAGAQ